MRVSGWVKLKIRCCDWACNNGLFMRIWDWGGAALFFSLFGQFDRLNVQRAMCIAMNDNAPMAPFNSSALPWLVCPIVIVFLRMHFGHSVTMVCNFYVIRQLTSFLFSLVRLYLWPSFSPLSIVHLHSFVHLTNHHNKLRCLCNKWLWSTHTRFQNVWYCQRFSIINI